MMIIILIAGHCQAQITNQFFADFNLEPKTVTVRTESIPKVFSFGEHLEANGSITKVGDSYEIVIDSEFTGDPERLIYFLMAHEFLGLTKSKTGLMNENAVYKRLTKMDIKRIKKELL
jgi:hypothetical protein